MKRSRMTKIDVTLLDSDGNIGLTYSMRCVTDGVLEELVGCMTTSGLRDFTKIVIEVERE